MIDFDQLLTWDQVAQLLDKRFEIFRVSKAIDTQEGGVDPNDRATAVNFCVETFALMLLCLPLVKSECNNLECREKLGSSAKSSTITRTEKRRDM